MKSAVFPGTFDPFTLGHESVVRKAIPLFDRIIVAVGHNSSKSAFFDLEKRMGWIRDIFSGEPSIKVISYTGLTVNMCREQKSQFIIRGLRSSKDFEYETPLAHMNHSLAPDVETVFFLCEPRYAAINATIVRDIIRNGGDASAFVPKAVVF